MTRSSRCTTSESGSWSWSPPGPRPRRPSAGPRRARVVPVALGLVREHRVQACSRRPSGTAPRSGGGRAPRRWPRGRTWRPRPGTPRCRCPGPRGSRPLGASSASRRCSASSPARTTGRADTALATSEMSGVRISAETSSPSRKTRFSSPATWKEMRMRAEQVLQAACRRRGRCPAAARPSAPRSGRWPRCPPGQAQPPGEQLGDGGLARPRGPVDGDDERAHAPLAQRPVKTPSARNFS